ncbi:MAG: D-alanine--D-alanine ligase [Bacteroidales bacterium]|jgi:D-alanine-D-alanine ligase|nr:D-alanine--D-alanine ligase [Bacteroidales bacterium]
MKKNIALIAGGDSKEREVSLLSAMEVEKNLDREKYNVYKIILEGNLWYYEQGNEKVFVDKNDFSLNFPEGKVLFDGVFIIIHGTPGENGLLQGYLEMLNIPFASCSSLVSAITFDKAVCNSVVREFNCVKVAKNVSFYKNHILDLDTITKELNFPLFVKPSQGGSSIGMSKVFNKQDLEKAIQNAFMVDDKIIIEEFIKGRELTCGVLLCQNKIISFPITEIISKNEFFDYDAKYKGLSNEVTPAQVSDSIKEKVQKTAEIIYKNLNCQGVCRIDFILEEKSEELYFLEINTIPGQSEMSIVPQQVRSKNWTTQQLYSKMLDEIL